MAHILSKPAQSLKFLFDANFYMSIVVLVIGGVLCVTDNYVIFDFNEELYGVMAQNLKVMILYLGLSELFLCGYSFYASNRRVFLFAGLFYIFLTGSLPFYGEINTVEIDPNLSLFFIYIGVSHVLYGLWEILPSKVK